MKKLLLLALSLVILNGAFFNRIGWRIAEKSYITILVKMVIPAAFDEPGKGRDHIAYSGKTVPTNLPGSNNTNPFTGSVMNWISQDVLVEVSSFFQDQEQLFFNGVCHPLRTFLQTPFRPPSL